MAHWRAVEKAKEGDRGIAEYLAGFGGGKPLEVLIGPPEIGGRFFYRDDMQGFNFQRQHVPLPNLVGELLKLAESEAEAPHAIYANAAAAPEHLPGWAEANPLDLPPPDAVPRLWIGNATQVATPFRRLAQPGGVRGGAPPLHPVPARAGGEPLSRAARQYAGRAAQFDGRSRRARSGALSALRRGAGACAGGELEPGDALYIPTIWWHHVRAFDRLNVLVNYWWSYDSSATPFVALVHALMSVRDLPPAQKQAWRAWFDHLVFGEDADQAAAHLPAHAQGVMGPASNERTEKIRHYLLMTLSGRG